jgi:hypothetical protein
MSEREAPPLIEMPRHIHSAHLGRPYGAADGAAGAG